MMPDGNWLINYPASDSLYVYNPSTGIRYSAYAGYSKPTNITRGDFTNQQEKAINQFRQYGYYGVLSDPINIVYYRIIRLPKENYDIDNYKEESKTQRLAVIILDSDLNIIGESLLDDGAYYPLFCFVDSKGLHINAESEDDDFMIYRTFRLLYDD